MAERVFVIMQVGAKDSPERKRADEIYKFIIAPAVKAADLDPYRADLDISPGPIAPKMLSELLNARIVIADLTGRNPNVFYELGIAHSFARPLISIADSSKSLPFDTKDERIIEIGEYPPSGLSYVQGEHAKESLAECLRIVLAEGYVPPSPLREVAANRSVDDLAPEDPVAAEMSQIREGIEDIRKRLPRRTVAIAAETAADLSVLRHFLERNMSYLEAADFDTLQSLETSPAQDKWTEKLRANWEKARSSNRSPDPWAKNSAGYSDEPPF
jgi:hypothetical protein